MNLLSLSAKNSVPAADDFLPVLVFVLVKANPPSLLSTVQYVESFYGNRLGGEDQYWWMQLVAGIKKYYWRPGYISETLTRVLEIP